MSSAPQDSPDGRAAKRVKVDASPAHDEGIQIVPASKGQGEMEALRDVIDKPAGGDVAMTGVENGETKQTGGEGVNKSNLDGTAKKKDVGAAGAETNAVEKNGDEKPAERKVDARDARDAGRAPIKAELVSWPRPVFRLLTYSGISSPVRIRIAVTRQPLTTMPPRAAARPRSSRNATGAARRAARTARSAAARTRTAASGSSTTASSSATAASSTTSSRRASASLARGASSATTCASTSRRVGGRTPPRSKGSATSLRRMDAAPRAGSVAL